MCEKALRCYVCADSKKAVEDEVLQKFFGNMREAIDARGAHFLKHPVDVRLVYGGPNAMIEIVDAVSVSVIA